MYTDAKLSKMWKLGCPVANIHEKYPVENIMKTQLKTLNCIVKKPNKQTSKQNTHLVRNSNWSQLNWYHPNYQLNWYVHT